MFAPKSLLGDLRSLFNLTDKRINPAQDKLLQHICVNPDITAYKMGRKKVLGNNIDDKSIRRDISDLDRKGFIKRLQKGNSEHKAKPCKLTIDGIVYLILKKRTMVDRILEHIFKNYGDNILFQNFLYPFIEKNTLLRLESLNSISPLSSFLYECSREIIDAVRTINTAKTTYIMDQVFVWQAVPSDNDHWTNLLREFLKRKFNLSWVDHAEFEKIDNCKTLRISHKAKSVLIKLNDGKTKAILKIKGEQKYEFAVRVHSEDCFVVEAPTDITIEEQTANFLLGTIESRIHTLVFNLISSVVAGFDDFRILSGDKIFMKTLEKTKVKFDEQYKLMTNGQEVTFHT
jgi:hypothetical protein